MPIGDSKIPKGSTVKTPSPGLKTCCKALHTAYTTNHPKSPAMNPEIPDASKVPIPAKLHPPLMPSRLRLYSLSILE